MTPPVVRRRAVCGPLPHRQYTPRCGAQTDSDGEQPRHAALSEL